MRRSSTRKNRCLDGKSCGRSCIFRRNICQIDLQRLISRNLSKVFNILNRETKGDPKKVKIEMELRKQAPSTPTGPKEELEEILAPTSKRK